MSCTPTVSSATLSENSFYVGINVQNILYGIQVGLYFKTIHVFLGRRRERRKSDVFYTAFSSVMLLLTTIRVASDGIYGEKIWLTDRSYPGGSLAYGVADSSDAYMVFGAAAVVILQQMTNALVMYRCRVVWDSLRVIVVPSVLWLANFAMGILVGWAAATPGANFFSIPSKLGLAYITSSVILNAMLTCMIWYWSVYHARIVKEYHRKEHASSDFSIDALVVESMLPYTLSGVAFLVSCWVWSETVIAFACAYTLMMCVSPQLLILRVVEGNAWQKDTMRSVGVLSPEREKSGGEHSDGSGAAVALHLETLPSCVYPPEDK